MSNVKYLVIFLLALFSQNSFSMKIEQKHVSLSDEINKISDLLQKAETNKESKLADKLLQEMSYSTTKLLEKLHVENEGNYEGIGVLIGNEIYAQSFLRDQTERNFISFLVCLYKNQLFGQAKKGLEFVEANFSTTKNEFTIRNVFQLYFRLENTRKVSEWTKRGAKAGLEDFKQNFEKMQSNRKLGGSSVFLVYENEEEKKMVDEEKISSQLLEEFFKSCGNIKDNNFKDGNIDLLFEAANRGHKESCALLGKIIFDNLDDEKFMHPKSKQDKIKEGIKYCRQALKEGEEIQALSQKKTVKVQELLKEFEKLSGKSCNSCHSNTENMKKCGRCKSVFYCSVECQKNDWLEHKKNCKNK